jgi:hypothetical protein
MPKNLKLQFFESKEEVFVEKNADILFSNKKTKLRITYFEISLLSRIFFVFITKFISKNISNLLSCSKFCSNSHQGHIFLEKLFYCKKNIKYRFLGLLLPSQ